tara:strand:+ start:51 stop:572 length:522 start_codon:yes stop_codon:yes gene_type:complete
MKAGKIWGQTELIHANGVLEFHRIEYKAGYKCSEHEHEFKWNGFFVESGKMLIRVWQNDYDLVDETILLPGDFTQVKPGCIHQFEGIESGVAFELYWAEFNHNDIKRRTIGTPTDTKEPEETDPLLRIMAEENDVFGSGKVLGNYNDNLSKDYSAVKDLEARALRAEALNKGV